VAAGKRFLDKNDPPRALLQFRNAAKLTPNNAEVHYQMARAFLDYNDILRGVASLRKAIEIDPKHAGAQLLLAKLYASADDPSLLRENQQRLQELLQSGSGNSDTVHTLGLTELRLGSPTDAIRHLEQAMAMAPQNLSYAVTLAQAKIQEKDWSGAEAVFKKACESSPKSPEAQILLGRFYAFQNNYPKAIDQFQKALLIDGKNAPALFNLAAAQLQSGMKAESELNYKKLSLLPYKPTEAMYALFLYEQGRRDEAIVELRRLAARDPDDREARTRLVAAYQTTNRYSEALKVLNDALKSNPKDLDALLQRGEIALNAGNLSDAELDLNRVLHLKQDSAQVHYAMSKLYKARGNILTQRQELNEVLRLNQTLLAVRLELAQSLISGNSSKAALEILDGTPDSQKNLLPTIEQRNWAYIGVGDAARARQGVDQGLAIGRTPDLLLQDAMLKIVTKRQADARQAVNEALQLAPGDTRALRLLVGSYAAQQQVSTGIAEVRAYAAKFPKSSEVQFFLGNLLLETGDKAGAQKAFSTAVSLNPQNLPAEMELARINLTDANWTDARQQLSTILTNKGDNPQARLWLGMLEESVGNHDAALIQFRKAVDSQPNDAIALNNLAYLLAEHAGKPDEALKYAEKAQEISPDNPDVQDTLGWVLYHKGLYDNAVTQLQAAASKGGSARQHYHLAMACLKAGQAQRARTVLQTALKKDPNLPEARIAKAMFGTP
jgi:tetratricopeptide (TPR) repeat protein